MLIVKPIDPEGKLLLDGWVKKNTSIIATTSSPLTTQVDFGSIARLNLALIQCDTASITSRQSETLLR
jgi:hypothetical protein